MGDGARGLATLSEGVGIALDAVRANKIRSFLTILGVAVGVSVVVAMAALVSGVRQTMFSAFEAAGPNNFMVMRFDFTAIRLVTTGRPPWWNKPEIVPEEAERIAALPAIDEALYSVLSALTVEFDGQRLSGIQSQGYSAGWPSYQPGDFIAGRNFTPSEVRRSRPVVVVSSSLAETLFGQRDPIGLSVGVSSRFRDGREEFTVVGVFEPEENLFTAAIDQWMIFPWSAGLKRLNLSTEQAQILVVPEGGVGIGVAQDQVIAALRSMRGLGPREENDFALVASAQLLETFDRLTGMFFAVMLGLSSAGLMVGGVGVVGIMLISVTERTREIGIRKAVGATRREILWQFLVEAAVLTSLGGAGGLAIGAALAKAVESATPVPASIPLWSVAVALATAAVTGMLCGLLPAVRASRLEPVVALRSE